MATNPSTLRQVLAQLLPQLGQGVADSFNATYNPNFYQQNQETKRTKMQLDAAEKARATLSAAEKAQLDLQTRAQDRLDTQMRLNEHIRQASEEDKINEFILTHPELKQVQPEMGLGVTKIQMPGAPQVQPGAMQPGQGETSEREHDTPAAAPEPDPLSALFGLPTQATRIVPTGLQTPSDAISLGGKLFARPTEEMVNVPPGSILETLFGAGKKLPLSKLSGPLLEDYIKTEQKRRDTEAHRAGLAEMEKGGLVQLQQLSTMDPRAANVFSLRLTNAKNSDSKSGNTSEMNQVLKDMGNYILTNSPEAKEAKRQTALADRKDLLTYAAALRQGPEADPEKISGLVDMALHNPDNYDFIKPLLTKNEKEALSGEFARRGVDFEKISNQTRESREYAGVAQKLITPIMAKVEDAETHGKLGALASRYNAFLQGTVGKGDPEYSQLSTEIDLMRKLVAKIHLGVRGAGSPQNAEQFKKKLDEGKMDAETLKAGLRAYSTFVNVYAGMGIRPYSDIRGGEHTNPAVSEDATATEPKWIVVGGQLQQNPKWKAK